MPSFGYTSKSRLSTCHPLIQLVCNRIIETYDITIVQYGGFRTAAEQQRLFERGASKVEWPDSKHNNTFEGRPYSLAVDIGPWPLDWDNLPEFHHMAGRVLQAADDLGIRLIWGGHWKTFKDYPHFELDPSMLESNG